jgi:hypothetical protein
MSHSCAVCLNKFELGNTIVQLKCGASPPFLHRYYFKQLAVADLVIDDLRGGCAEEADAKGLFRPQVGFWLV